MQVSWRSEQTRSTSYPPRLPVLTTHTVLPGAVNVWVLFPRTYFFLPDTFFRKKFSDRLRTPPLIGSHRDKSHGSFAPRKKKFAPRRRNSSETGPGPRRAVLARPRRTHADPEIQQGQLQRTTAQHRPWPGRPVPAGRPDCTSRFFPAMGNEYSSCLGCCGNDSDDTRLLKKGLSSHSDNVPNGVHTWSDAASRL